MIDETISKLVVTIDVETIPLGEPKLIKVADLPDSFIRPETVIKPVGYKDPEKVKLTKTEIKDFGINADNELQVRKDKITVANAYLISERKLELQNKIDTEIAMRTGKEFRDRALDPTKGRILCASVKVNDGKTVSLHSMDEIELGNMLANELMTISSDNGYREMLLVGHNIAFDLGFIHISLLKAKRNDALELLPKGRYDTSRIFDTMRGMIPYDIKYISLDNACAVFGLQGKLSDMNGGKVYDEFHAGNIAKICEYCNQDVDATYELFKRIYIAK